MSRRLVALELCTEVSGVRIAYQDSGAGPPNTVLLIMGIGAPATRWPTALIDGLVAAGVRVLAFDNRDCGLSEQLSGEAPDFRAIAIAIAAAEPPPVLYTVTDMAADAIAVLDAAAVAAAHVVGASMGGAIAQILTIAWPGRVRSLTTIMSSTGAPGLPPMSDRVRRLVADARDRDDENGRIAALIRSAEAGRSPGFATDAEAIRDRAIAEVARGFTLAGRLRQAAALAAASDRSDALAGIAVPVTVVHGDADELFPIAHGEATARAVPDAKLVTIAGMAHDLPDGAVPALLAAILATIARVTEHSCR